MYLKHLDRIIELLEVIAVQLEVANRQGRTMSKELDDLSAAVTTETSVEASAVTLIGGLASQVADLAAAAKAAGTGVDPAAVEALAGQISASSAALAAAVAANTAPPAPAS